MLDSGSGERLWHADGPLDKYDYYVRARTGSFPSPYTTTWEYQNHRTTDQKNNWWGHCNGWAAASIREPEPAAAAWVEGIYFRIADKKGILSEWHNATMADGNWGNRYNGPGDDLADIYPYEFMTVLIEHIVSQDEPVVMDLDCWEEVWNHPIYGYELEETERYGDEARFDLSVYYATDAVSSDFAGTWEKIAKYEFWCTVDGAGNPAPGPSSWAGSSSDSHPDFLWHPGTDRGDGNPALETQHVHDIAATSPSDFAHLEIRHTFRGDLTVQLGAGSPANPDWVTTLSEEEGGSADDLVLDVDVSAAEEYLPPAAQHPWFLLVTDDSEGDVGRIAAFRINHDGRRYDAGGLPVDIADGETSLAHIGSPPSSSSLAHIEIRHPYRGDLVAKVGVGDPADPSWVTTVSDREGGDADDLVADVDLSGAETYLPPDGSHPWFLEVSDGEAGDEGSIQAFTISHGGSFFSSNDVPVPVPDLETSYAHIGGSSSLSCMARIDIRHTWCGDLVVRVGAGSPDDPEWVTTVSDREGEDAQALVRNVVICAAETHLPPSQSHPWFLEVSDNQEGDEGSIVAFAIAYRGSTYGAAGLPVPISDGETSYATIGPSSSLITAHIEIQHPYRGDLVVRIGAGAPATPGWVATVSDRDGEDADDLIRDVDISDAEAHLPPDSFHPWFLEVSDGGGGDEGSIVAFTISYEGRVFSSGDPPVDVVDDGICYAYIGRGAGGAAPLELVLYQNRPNPFNPVTVIPFELPVESRVTLRVYDVKGRAVRTLAADVLAPDFYTAVWDGRDDGEREVASGAYYYRLETGGRTLTKKMLLLR
jgi:subtilisin-like proprotein convertase family protein